ncbi:MAG: hypothetical protein LBU32_19970 [Clostridiales bacterium]|nr:hypothetical protein [Clostridiales bacterium]
MSPGKFEIQKRNKGFSKIHWEMLGATMVLLAIGFFSSLLFFDFQYPSLYADRIFCTALGVAAMALACVFSFSIISESPKSISSCIAAISISALLISRPSSNFLVYLTLFYPLSLAALVFSEKGNGKAGILKCCFVFAAMAALAASAKASAFITFAVASSALFGMSAWKDWFKKGRRHTFFMFLAASSCASIAYAISIGNQAWVKFKILLNPYIGVKRETSAFLANAGIFGRRFPDHWSLYAISSADLSLVYLIAFLGWSAFACIAVVFIFLLARGLFLSLKQKSCLELFVSFSILATLAAEAIGYTLYNFGFQLCTPVAFPLISRSKSGIIANLILIGIMMSSLSRPGYPNEHNYEL